MVPKLKNAWKIGMIARPMMRSLAAPDTFIATSHMPMEAPKTASPMMVTRKLGPNVAPTPAAAKPIGPTVRHQAIVVRAPNRAMMWLDASNPTIEPTAMPKMRRPISAVVACRESRTAGTRATQLASAIPHRAKTTNSAFLQATASARVSPPPTVAGARGMALSGMGVPG